MSKQYANKAFLLTAVILLSTIAAVNLHYQSEIRELEANQKPETAFLFTTAIVAETHDGDGNLVQRVEKFGDLPTTNWGYLFSAALFSSQNTVSRLSVLNNSVMKDTTGVIRDIDKNSAGQSDIMVGHPRIGWGSGTTAANISQYELVTKDGWDTPDQLMYFHNTTHMWVRMKMTYEFSTAKTINEVALYLSAQELGYGTTSSNYLGNFGNGSPDDAYGDIVYINFHDAPGEGYITVKAGDAFGRFMVFRDVLGSTLSVAANEAMTITYFLYIQYA